MVAPWFEFWCDTIPAASSKSVQLMALGKTNEEIAAETYRSIDCVKHHLTMANRACGTRNRVELARWWWLNVEVPVRQQHARRLREAA